MGDSKLGSVKCRRGAHGGQVMLIQEWLSLNGFKAKIDGDFGVATVAAVKLFQEKKGLAPSGVVDRQTFESLIAPMKMALRKLSPRGKGIGTLALAYAQRHLEQHPMEVGGQNRGPWVRLYMDGNEGATWAWCAGFVCFCVKEACDTLSVSPPIRMSFSCDTLARSALKQDLLLEEPTRTQRSKITPGSLFLVRGATSGWTHTGFVVSAEPDVFHTIEGNTNDDGGREGFEVCKRIRAYGGKDFILLG